MSEAIFRFSPKDLIYVLEKDAYYVVSYVCDGGFFTISDLQEAQFPSEREFMSGLDSNKGVVLLWTPYEMQREYIWINLLKMPFRWYAKEVNLGFGVYVAFVFKSESAEYKVGDYIYTTTNEDLSKLPDDFQVYFAYTYPLVTKDVVFYASDTSIREDDKLHGKKGRFVKNTVRKKVALKAIGVDLDELFKKLMKKGGKRENVKEG